MRSHVEGSWLGLRGKAPSRPTDGGQMIRDLWWGLVAILLNLCIALLVAGGLSIIYALEH